MRQIFLDTETTGLSAAQGDRVIEIGCIEMDRRRPTGRTLHHYLNPQRPSNPEAVKVHGITDEFLADKPLFESIADELLDFVQGAEVIIHNAEFDLGFLDAELCRLGRGPFSKQVGSVTDTLVMARNLFPGKSNSLDALCRRLEVDNTNRTLHGALLDAGLLAEVYIRLTRGQDSLVIDATGDSGHSLQLDAVDLSAYALTTVEPAPAELAAHAALLAELDKASGDKTVWRQFAMAAPSAVA